MKFDDEVMLYRQPDRNMDVLIIAFSSLSAGSIEHLFEFWNLLERDDCGVLLLRDPDNSWYHRLRGLPPGPGAVADLLAGYARRYRRVVCIGYSMGGYAALLFGRMLGADTILALAPQTRMTLAAMEEWGDRRWQPQIEQLAEDGDPRFLDLADLYRDTRHLLPEQQVTLCACSDAMGLDLRHAYHLADFCRVQPLGAVPLPHVTLVAGLRQSGVLRALINGMVAGVCDAGEISQRYIRWMARSRHSVVLDPSAIRIDGGMLELAGTLAVHAASLIPCDADPAHPVRLGIRLWPEGADHLRRETRHVFPVADLLPGSHHAFAARLDLADLPPGMHTVVAALVRENRFWFDEVGFTAATLEIMVGEDGTPSIADTPRALQSTA